MTQRDSKIQSVRDYGCYFCCLVEALSRACGKFTTVDERDDIFRASVAAGKIRDNGVPVSQPGWWRAFVLDPAGVVEVAAEHLGTLYRGHELIRQTMPVVVKAPPETTDTIIEHQTTSGSHFVLGRAGTLDVAWDPWPGLPRSGVVRTIRHWEFR